MHSSPSSAPPRRQAGGFTLVEIMVVVVMIGLLAILAIPAFQKARRASQTNRFISDLRTFAQAFESYSLQNGSWPPTATNGVVPTGMTGELRREVWSRETSVGGQWNWEFDATTGIAATEVSSVTASLAQMLEIDARIDDGDLVAGLFQKVGTNYVYYLHH
jgi:prepilin-type N-terminal cleavage/methylation domain-containing protein